MKNILLVISIFLSTNAYACYQPIGGSEYDEKIFVTKGKIKNTYYISVPIDMKNMLRETKIILAYSKRRPGGIPIYDRYEVLKLKVDGNNLVAEFKVEKKPYIVIMW